MPTGIAHFGRFTAVHAAVRARRNAPNAPERLARSFSGRNAEFSAFIQRPRAALEGKQRLAERVVHHRLVPTLRLQPVRHR